MSAAMRDAYGAALLELGGIRPDVVVLDADLGNSIRCDAFGQRYPDRYIEVGIAEQNMVGVAAGLAACGLVPVVNSFAVFAVCRALDQIRTSVCQPGLPVKIVGSYSGLAVSKGGSTHASVEDIAIMRALPGMTVIVPGDAAEAAQATRLLPEIPGPVYLRLYRNAVPAVVPEGYRFQPGRAVPLRPGRDVAIISTGTMTARALEAARRLAQRGVEAAVLHVPTVKPLDAEAVVEAAEACGVVVTAEEHSVIGGLGAAVAECLGERRPTPVHRVGVPDRYGESGPDEALLAHMGVDAAAIERQALAALGIKLP
ncbi:transketolase family protein [Symbiobacterium terraclitae]|uniref:transketolase family protein n=1 Tax=Symbiobacterium terraclitae TaxID=557451 RepID=UPI0035B55DF3